MVHRRLAEKQELAPGVLRKLQQAIGVVRIVAENERAFPESRLDRPVFLGLVVGAVIAVVDEQIDRRIERAQRLQRVAVADLAVLTERTSQQIPRLWIDVEAVVAAGMA